MNLLGLIDSIGITGALLAALWQLYRANRDNRQRDADRRTERSLALYEAVVAEGSTYEAFHRLSVFLRREGTRMVGATTWRLLQDHDLEPGGLLDPSDRHNETPFADLYSVLWFFERVEISLDKGLVDREVLMQTLGFHFWWWGQLLCHLHGPKASSAIHHLSVEAQEWASAKGHLHDWRRRCQHDFDGQEAQKL